MSGSYRGLPPPAVMSSGQPLPLGSHQQPPPAGGPASVGQGPPPPPLPPSSASRGQQQQQQHLGQLPPPPGWQSSEDSMRVWLHAKAEEEKRRQEEERTNQERFRLEQRKTEFEILRASLQGGIPPPMVPVVFAGMGGATLPPAALDWAQQFAQQVHQQQLLPGPASPRHRRDSHPQAYGHYQGSGAVPSTPGSGQGVHSSFVGGYPASPRTRRYTVPAPGTRFLAGGGSGLASLNTSVLPSSGGTVALQSHPGVGLAQQQESQQSPSIYFHMWQPPSNQNSQSGSNQPSTPSVEESPRKRKAAGPQQAAPPPSTQQRFRSPPFSQSTGSTVSNPPPGQRRGYSRQTSDGSTTYRRGQAETIGSSRSMSPLSNAGPVAADREMTRTPAELSSFAHQPPAAQTRNVAHSVSSLLSSDDPSLHAVHSSSTQAADTRGQPARVDSQQGSPHLPEDRSRVGGVGPATPRERRDEGVERH